MTWFLLGQVFQKAGRYEEAIFAYRAAVSVDPDSDCDHVRSWFQLGRVLGLCGDTDGSIFAYERVLDSQPHCREAFLNLGQALLDTGDLTRAEEIFLSALKIDPTSIPALVGLASVALRRGEFERSSDLCMQVLALEPENSEVQTTFAILNLRKGNFSCGWALYESRRESEKHREVEDKLANRPEWTGESLQGKTIYVYPEQGFGDVIQLVRYFPLLHERGARVLFPSPPGLARLLRGSPLAAEILPFETSPQEITFDLFSPLGSLPLRFETDFATIPSPESYLLPDPEMVRQEHGRISMQPGFRVGIVWQGNPNHSLDSVRSIGLAELEPMLRIVGAQFYALQVGSGREQISRLSPDLRLTDLASSIEDFSDTAAIVTNLDLVVTVDTAVAHLSGALGVPTWILLPVASDWRWLQDRDDSPWYSTVRLFRQSEPGEWSTVVSRVVGALHKLVPTVCKKEAPAPQGPEPLCKDLKQGANLMLLGNILHNSTSSVFTVPVNRGGKKAVFSLDILQAEGTTPTLACEVQHKNLAENLETDWASIGSFSNTTTTGVITAKAEDLKEQIRLKFTLSGGASVWMRVQELPISWME